MSRLRLFHSILVALIALAGGACSSTPSVRYQTQPAEDDKGLIKFYLSGTDITLAKTGTGPSGIDLADNDVTATSTLTIARDIKSNVKALLTPREDQRLLYAVVPEASWLGTVRTNLSVTYFDTTDTSLLIKSIGSVVQDNRAKIVSALGAVASAAIVFAYAEEDSRKPRPITLRLPVSIYLNNVKDGKWRELPRNSDWRYKFVVSPAGVASIKSEVFFARYGADHGTQTAVFPFSSCRVGTLHVKYHSSGDEVQESDQGDVKFSVMFADPDFISTLKLPESGSIKFHAVCGADLATDKSEIKTTWDLVEALMSQVKTIKDNSK